MRFRTSVTRQSFIPPQAVKLSDKFSSAVAYVYTTRTDKPAVLLFHGKRQKPDRHFSYQNVTMRTKAIINYFKAIQQAEQVRKDRQKQTPTLVVGDILNTCWGYDQTNREFFEVIAVKGKSVTVREIAQVRVSTGDMTGKCAPQSGEYIGKQIRRLCRGDTIKIDDVRYASKWNTRTVAGVPVGYAVYYSEYA